MLLELWTVQLSEAEMVKTVTLGGTNAAAAAAAAAEADDDDVAVAVAEVEAAVILLNVLIVK